MSTKGYSNTGSSGKSVENDSQVRKIVDQFQKLDNDLRNAILAEASSMKEITTIADFNSAVGDTLNFIINLTRQNKKYVEYDFSGFEVLFKTGIKADAKIAISNFIMTALPVADKILLRQENYFLNEFDHSHIDQVIENKGSGLNIFTSEKFKELWKKMDLSHQEHIMDKVGLLVYKGFVYFVQISGMNKK